MSGRRIDDHSSWLPKAKKGMVLPEGAHSKEYSSAEGAGSVMRYEDTSEQIKKAQEDGEAQIKRHPQKTGYRY